MSERFVDAAGLASHLGVAIKTIYNWRSKGRLPAHYLPGGKPLYKISEVERKMSCRKRRRTGGGS